MPEQAQGRLPLVLIADAHEWSARSWASLLGPRGYAVLRAHSGPEVVTIAAAQLPDAIVVQDSLPGTDVLSLVQTLRADAQVPLETVVIVTAAAPTSRPWRLAALRAGVNDVWGVPLDTEEMTLRLEAQLRAKFAASRARDEGLIDSATGLYNRKGLAVRARDLASHASRRRAALACVVFALDLDGDALRLQRASTGGGAASAVHALAEGLKHAARTSDAVGRLGPAEFAVFAPDTDARGAKELGTRLANSIARGGAGRRLRPPLRLRAGYDGVDDFHAAGLEPLDLLTRATSALHTATQGTESAPGPDGGNGSGGWIRPFEGA